MKRDISELRKLSETPKSTIVDLINNLGRARNRVDNG